jgi:hypothetical protein
MVKDLFNMDVGLTSLAGLSFMSGSPGPRHRAAFAGLVARHAEMVGNLMAGASDHQGLRAELAKAGRIGGQDAARSRP